VSYVEINLEDAVPSWTTLSDGRRAIVSDERRGSGVLLILPERDAYTSALKLHLACERMYPEIRAAERGEVHRPPAAVIVAPAGEWSS
jgi:hypothetical protein